MLISFITLPDWHDCPGHTVRYSGKFESMVEVDGFGGLSGFGDIVR